VHYGCLARLVTPRLVAQAVHDHGVLGTAQKSLNLLVRLPRNRRAGRADRRFDEERRVDTAGIIPLAALAIESPNRRFGVRYQPTNPVAFHRLLSALPVGLDEFTFVDYGAGKGRVLLMAGEYPFRRIIGVEFSPELLEVARRNLATSPGLAERVELVCMDAVEFEPPPEPLVLYFYNPFAVGVMRAVLERVSASLQRLPRPAYALLTGDSPLGDVLMEAGFKPLPGGAADPRRTGVFAFTNP